MLVWRGRGIIIPFLALLAVALPLECKELWLMRILQGASFIVAGILCWVLGSKWNKGQNQYSEAGRFHWKDIFEAGLPESETSTLPEYSPSHSFTLIKVEFWGIIFFIVALFFLIAGLIRISYENIFEI